jgi:hypothetical protein
MHRGRGRGFGRGRGRGFPRGGGYRGYCTAHFPQLQTHIEIEERISSVLESDTDPGFPEEEIRFGYWRCI